MTSDITVMGAWAWIASLLAAVEWTASCPTSNSLSRIRNHAKTLPHRSIDIKPMTVVSDLQDDFPSFRIESTLGTIGPAMPDDVAERFLRNAIEAEAVSLERLSRGWRAGRVISRPMAGSHLLAQP